jgi:DtxR family Mn-dependent transcriptional regulator
VKITISKENYLKTISEAESEGEAVIAATLTRWLKVSAPAVTMAIKRLKRDSLIKVGKEGQITLTPEGKEIANRLLNRHHLIERMLTEIFGMNGTKSTTRPSSSSTQCRRISSATWWRSWAPARLARTAIAP